MKFLNCLNSSLLITLGLLICVSHSTAAGRPAGGGVAPSGSGLKSGITGPEKPVPISKPDGINKGVEGVKNDIARPAGVKNGRNLTNMKENAPEGKTALVKEKASAAKEKASETVKNGPDGYQTKASELRAKASKNKTGEQKANFEKLAADIETIKSGSSVTAEMKKKFADDLSSALSTANAPSADTVKKFATDLSAAAADQKIGPKEVMQLSEDIDAILNSAGISEDAAEALKKDALQIIEAANISAEEKEIIKTDIESIVVHAKGNALKLKTAAESGTADVDAAKNRVEEVKARKNSVRERIKEIKKGGR